MLQDLDARGSQAGPAMQSDIRPVAYPERAGTQRALVLGLAAGALVAGGAAGAWLYFKRPQAVPEVPAPSVAVVTVPVQAKPAPAVQPPVQPVPAQQAVAAAPPPAPAPAPAAPGRVIVVTSPAADERFDAPAPRAERDPIQAQAYPVPEAVPARSDSQPGVVRTVSGGSVLVAPLAGGRNTDPAQRAENDYRRALAALQDGRVGEAMAALEQVLALNPRHEAARQSLVGLLIEAGRTDEAMRQLEAGLALDPQQPALAMLLARMQIERGGSGVATLLRSLSAARGSADYLAFLGGALQRDNRHREAVQQYQGALRSAPDNGVWWMGLGISLQAEKRKPEALEAFRRAKASSSLSDELQAFVAQRMQQVAP
ncbi:MAG: tetratricopeptide repeat protein [Pseudomonadota bacterium]